MEQRRIQCFLLIADEHPVLAHGLSEEVSSLRDTTVKACRPSQLEAVAGEVDVVVMDPWVEGEFRADVIDSAKRLWPSARILVLTSHNEPGAIIEALEHGCHSFILKSEPVEMIRTAIELVCRGGIAFSFPVAAVIAAAPVPEPHGSAIATLHAATTRGLSAREIEVVQLIARGHTDADIARLLDISPRTVERHVANVLNKLGCRNRSEAVATVVGGAAPLARKGQRPLRL